MEYVNLGATGLRVSRVCLGMMSFGNDSDRRWTLSEQDAEPIVRPPSKAASPSSIPPMSTATVRAR